jgi:hypothetical protein
MRSKILVMAGGSGLIFSTILAFFVLPSVANAHEPRQVANGWWWRSQDASQSLPNPIDADQIAVGRSPYDFDKIAATKFDVSDVSSLSEPVIIHLRHVRTSAATTTAEMVPAIRACLATSPWVSADAGAWSWRPRANCAEGAWQSEPGANGYWSFDITHYVQYWIDGVVENHGVVFVPVYDNLNPSYDTVLDDLRPEHVQGLGGGAPVPGQNGEGDSTVVLPTVPAPEPPAASEPSAPQAPAVPEASAPDTPEVPGTPAAPGAPELSAPEAPGAPEGPGAPRLPDVPELSAPGTPTMPGLPGPPSAEVPTSGEKGPSAGNDRSDGRALPSLNPMSAGFGLPGAADFGGHPLGAYPTRLAEEAAELADDSPTVEAEFGDGITGEWASDGSADRGYGILVAVIAAALVIGVGTMAWQVRVREAV